MMRSPNQFARNLVALAGLFLLLTACAHDELVTVWTKPNVSDEQRYKDLSACKRYANQEMAGRRGAQQDLEIMSGGVNSGIKPSLNQNIGAYSDAKEYDALLRDCMTGAGYQAVK